MKTYNIVIASDHSGYQLKQKILDYFNKNNITVKDLGPLNEEKVDYPDYAEKVSDFISEGFAKLGILVCGTGIGMSIAANRRLNIRAALCFNKFMAQRARSHNDANILVLGSKIVEDSEALSMVEKFLNTKFEGGRHTVRLAKIK